MSPLPGRGLALFCLGAVVVASYLLHVDAVAVHATDPVRVRNVDPRHASFSRANDTGLARADRAQRVYADTERLAVCQAIANQSADDAVPVETPEPAARRVVEGCRAHLAASNADIVSRLQSAADAGSQAASLDLAQRRIDSDAADLDAVKVDVSPEELAMLRERYAADVRALSDLALHGDAAAARQFAELQSAGTLLPPDPVRAAGWQLYASMIDQSGTLADTDLIRDPALDDLGQDDALAAVAYAHALQGAANPSP
ncbi:hypothetical protein [Luteibacter sp. ME-Dv--P-043b]|jgi:hypothetical protein|uniref:hypothetical protein n=1 Tax=Lysobacterales TaxID=135614 RepID=UPI002552A5EF|nr:hypothetical protein [Luteibacter sp. ME-Dv--P-043b]